MPAANETALTDAYLKSLDDSKEAFWVSDFYFRGESPGERIVNWHIWWDAWKTARETEPSIAENDALEAYIAKSPAASSSYVGQIHRIWSQAWGASRSELTPPA